MPVFERKKPNQTHVAFGVAFLSRSGVNSDVEFLLLEECCFSFGYS